MQEERRPLNVKIAKLLGWTWDDLFALSPSGAMFQRAKDLDSEKPFFDPWWWLEDYAGSMSVAWKVIEFLAERGLNPVIEHDTDYGANKRTGWSVHIDRRCLVELVPLEELPEGICRAALSFKIRKIRR